MENSVESIKKIELHRHLEGCIDSSYFRSHLEKFFPNHKLLKEDRISKLFNYSNFMEFLNTWSTVMETLTELEHFRELAKYVIKQLKEENIIYCELIFSPQPFVSAGIDNQQLLEILFEEFNAAGIQTRLIIDFVRNFGADAMDSYLSQLIQVRNGSDVLEKWITAVSIGGDEVNYPARFFTNSFQKARKSGFQLYAHAGEWANFNSIWDSINHLGIKRIGHGIQAVKDTALMDYLITKSIGLDISITSNYLTNAVEEGIYHPVKDIYEYGCPITLNTDDPGFFQTDLNSEYHKFLSLGFSITDLTLINHQAVDLTFLDVDDKETLRKQLS